MKKILIICDKPNWAYGSIARAIKKYNNDPNILIDTYFVKTDNHNLEEIIEDYDIIFPMAWQLISQLKTFSVKELYPYLDIENSITGIHSHHSWDKRKTTPDKNVKPPKMLIKHLNRFRAVNAVSKKLYTLFKGSGLKNIFYTPNGVDIEIFKPIKPLLSNGTLAIGFSGNTNQVENIQKVI